MRTKESPDVLVPRTHRVTDLADPAGPATRGARPGVDADPRRWIILGVFLTITQYFQFVLGWSPLQAAMAQIPNALTMVVVAPRRTVVVRRFGRRVTIVAGLCLQAAGFLLLSTAGLTANYCPMLIALALIGSGSGLVFPPTTAMIMESVPNRRAGMGSGVNDAGREVGGVLGIAVLGSLLATAYHAGLHGLLGALHPRDAEGARRSIGGALRSRSTSAASAAPRSPTEPAPRSSTGCNSPCVESVAVR